MAELELEEEYRFFESKKLDWMGRYEGKYLLIKGRELIDHFATVEDAYKDGVRKFGNKLFFIKKLVRVEHHESIPALTQIGLEISFPGEILEGIDKVVEILDFNSREELIRCAVRRFVDKFEPHFY